MADREDKQMDAGALQEAVRQTYAGVAERGASCCAQEPSCCSQAASSCATQLYSREDLEALTDGAAAASAGCGNPTALAELKPGEVVLDLGSGGGIDCFLAARAVGPEGQVIGVDFTPEMVDLARANARELGAGNVTFKQGPIEAIPQPDATVDVIISNCVIVLAPDKDAVFAEALRVLKPGGRLMVSDMVLTAALPESVVEDISEWVTCVAGAEPVDVYLDRIRRAGFVDVTIVDDRPMPAEEGREWQASVHSLSVRATKPLS